MCNQEQLIAYIYDELPPGERRAFETHVAGCLDCRREVRELRGTRQHLTTWAPPDPEFNFRVVREPVAAPPRRFAFVPQWAMAAAASILLAAAALGIANVEVRRTADGFVVRTGWASHADDRLENAAARPSPPQAAPVLTPAAASTPSSEEWTTAMARLQERVEAMERAQPVQAARAAGPVRGAITAAELRQILTAAEARQRAETALQIRQVWNDINAARVNDFARVQQTLNQAQGLTTYQLKQQRDSIEYLRAVSQQK